MYENNQLIVPLQDPIDALWMHSGPGVLAVISHIQGPSYRNIGSIMAFLESPTIWDDGKAEMQKVGHLSSGCIESDLALQARKALRDHKTITARYGAGSPYIDMQLPCGGGLEVTLIPNPDQQVLRQLTTASPARIHYSLTIDLRSGSLSLGHQTSTQRQGDHLVVSFPPDLQFVIIDKGAEASTFAALAGAAGYGFSLLSPCADTLEQAPNNTKGQKTTLSRPILPKDLMIDPWTAIVLFFHDHDWEPPILDHCLGTSAFYLGAQGSMKAAATRKQALQEMGHSPKALERICGPIGLIPSVRDPKTLAVSVLAEILARFQEQT
jgi:xanthine dehydrogenase accessory factor